MRLFRVLKDFYSMLVDKKYTTLAGSISFFLLINGGATIFLILIIINSLNIHFDTLYFSESLFPSEINTLIDYILASSTNITSGYSLIFIFSSIWGASNLFYQLMQSGELLFNHQHKVNGYLRRTISLIIMMLFVFVLVLSIGISVMMDVIIGFLNISIISVIWQRVATLFVPFILLTFINLYIPPIKIKALGAVISGIFTSLFWLIASTIFSLYIRYFSNIKEVYGALAFIIVFMLWIYLLTTGIIIGFVLNYRFQKKERKITLNDGNIMMGDNK